MSTKSKANSRRADGTTSEEITMGMQQRLFKRREALLRAMAGDLSRLQELKTQAGGDIVDIAADVAVELLSYRGNKLGAAMDYLK